MMTETHGRACLPPELLSVLRVDAGNGMGWIACRCLAIGRPRLCKKVNRSSRTVYKTCTGDDKASNEGIGSVAWKAMRGEGDPKRVWYL